MAKRNDRTHTHIRRCVTVVLLFLLLATGTEIHGTLDVSAEHHDAMLGALEHLSSARLTFESGDLHGCISTIVSAMKPLSSLQRRFTSALAMAHTETGTTQARVKLHNLIVEHRYAPALIALEDLTGKPLHRQSRVWYRYNVTVLSDRKQLAEAIFSPSSGGVGVEVGVADGEFSQILLESAAPVHLTLIDPWAEQQNQQYSDINNLKADQQQRRYTAVMKRFASVVSTGQVEIVRDFSSNSSLTVVAGSLDWVYLDGNHRYDAVVEDIMMWAPKVRPGGHVCGHDFIDGHFDYGEFGVRRAVFDYLERHHADGTKLVAVTAEDWPSWCFVRGSNPYL